MSTLQRSLSIALVLAIGGCTSASIESTWRSPTAPELTNVVTLSPAPDGVTRRSVEDQLAQQLSRHGVRAVPGYTVLSDQDLSDRAGMVAKLRADGFDGVVAMRLVGANQKLEYYPAFDDYWGGAWGSVVPETVVRIQVNAYSLSNNKLEWSAMSKSVDPDSENQVIGDVTKVVGDRLAKERIIGPAQATMQ